MVNRMEFLLELLFQFVFEIPILRAILLAVVPALLLLLYVRRKDRLEVEPPKLIWQLVGLGALAVVAASVLELAGLFLLTRVLDTKSFLFQALQWFVVVGAGEELCKYFMLRRRTWKEPAFNCTFDALVYAVAVSAGFALAENILYVFRYGFGVVFIRAIVSIPAHICFSVFMGAWYRAAKIATLEHQPDKARRASWLAVLVPALAHGAFDFIASNTDSGAMTVVFIIYVVAMFIVSWRLLKKLADEDAYLQEKIETTGLDWERQVNP